MTVPLICSSSWSDDVALPTFVIGIDPASGLVTVQAFSVFPDDWNGSDSERQGLNAAIAFACDRAWRCFLATANWDPKDLRDQDANIFLALTDNGPAWLGSVLHFGKMAHFQSPLLSRNCRPATGPLSPKTSRSERLRQYDHASWKWHKNGNPQALGGLHLTSVRDGGEDFIYRSGDVDHIYAETVFNCHPAHGERILKSPEGTPRQLLYMVLSPLEVNAMARLTRKLRIGGSLIEHRPQSIIQTAIPPTQTSNLNSILDICRRKLRNHFHLFDLRTNSGVVADNSSDLFHMEFCSGPKGGYKEVRKILSFGEKPAEHRSTIHLIQEPLVEGLPEDREYFMRSYQSPASPDFVTLLPEDHRLLFLTEHGQPAFAFAGPPLD